MNPFSEISFENRSKSDEGKISADFTDFLRRGSRILKNLRRNAREAAARLSNRWIKSAFPQRTIPRWLARMKS
ncbi:MAG TPA: hypothetical protein VIS74_07295, partial [Chthoniobacterales bacterium]